VDENVRKTIQQALQNDGVWDIIDGSQSQFFEVGHPYTHLVLTDAALYEKVLESMRALKRNSAKNLGYIVRSRWDIVAVEYKGPYYDSTGNLRTASEINVTLKSGARIQRVRVAVTYMASRALQEWTGAAENDSDATRGGLRLDWEPSDINRLTLQGDYYQSDSSESFDEALLTPPFVNTANFTEHDDGGNILGHWTHDFSETSQLTLQMYYDYMEQGDAPAVIRNDAYDVDLQHRFTLGDRQDIVWGLGYRYEYEAVTTNSFVSFAPPVTHQTILSAFVQDEIKLARSAWFTVKVVVVAAVIQDRLHLTIGSKFEHNDFTGFEIEPSARLAWTPTEKQTVWVAVSRAVRTPTKRPTSPSSTCAPGSGNPPACTTLTAGRASL